MKLRGQKIVAFDRYGQKQRGQDEFVIQWAQSQLPVESDLYYDQMLEALGDLVHWTYLFDVSCTCINQLLPPAIDPEDSSLEHIVEGVDEVYQRL